MSVHVCSNPEFLKEGAAIDDFMKPDRVVVGVDNDHAREVMRELYAPFVRTGNPDPLHGHRVGRGDQVRGQRHAGDAHLVHEPGRRALRAGRRRRERGAAAASAPTARIGTAFLFPGPGYGGSCFPKDVQALIHSARQFGLVPDLLEAVEAVNQRQKQVLFAKLQRALGGSMRGRTVAVWGLAFKAGDRRHARERRRSC